MEIGWALGILFVFVTIVFIAIAFFLPEWVGITGNKAREIMEEQRGTVDIDAAEAGQEQDKPKDPVG